MNDMQRQLLADRIDDRARSRDRYMAHIAQLELQLAKKKTRLAEVNEELEKLKEGVDW